MADQPCKWPAFRGIWNAAEISREGAGKVGTRLRATHAFGSWAVAAPFNPRVLIRSSG
ncbi:protein of unknown function (plasmid) [Caballeronia sp. S22]